MKISKLLSYKFELLLIAVFLLSVLFRIPVLLADLQTFLQDTTRWIGPALNFVTYGAAHFNYLPVNDYGIYTMDQTHIPYYVSWPLLPFYVYSLVIQLVGESTITFRLLPLIFNGIAALYLYLIVTYVFSNKWIGLGVFALFLFLPGNYFYSMQVCDTPFWVMGWYGALYHFIRYTKDSNPLHAGLYIGWILFACLGSWIAYFALLSLLFTAFYMHIKPLWNQHKWQLVKQSSFYALFVRTHVVYVGLVSIAFLLFHVLLVQHLVDPDSASVLSNKWEMRTATGDSIVSYHIWGLDVPGWLSRILIVFVDTGFLILYHIPILLGHPLALTAMMGLIVLLIPQFRKRFPISSEAIRIIQLCLLAYLFYMILFPNHSRGHTFTVYLLVPGLLIIIGWLVRGFWKRIKESTRFSKFANVPFVLVIIFVGGVNGVYLIGGPALLESSYDLILYGRNTGKELRIQTQSDDLILSNIQYNYFMHALRLNSRRTIIPLIKTQKDMDLYIENPLYKGIVYMYETHTTLRWVDPLSKTFLAQLPSNCTTQWKIDTRIYCRLR